MHCTTDLTLSTVLLFLPDSNVYVWTWTYMCAIEHTLCNFERLVVVPLSRPTTPLTLCCQLQLQTRLRNGSYYQIKNACNNQTRSKPLSSNYFDFLFAYRWQSTLSTTLLRARIYTIHLNLNLTVTWKTNKDQININLIQGASASPVN